MLDYKTLLKFSPPDVDRKDKTQMIIDKILANNNISANCINIIDNRSSSVYEYKLNGYSVKFSKIKNLTDTLKKTV